MNWCSEAVAVATFPDKIRAFFPLKCVVLHWSSHLQTASFVSQMITSQVVHAENVNDSGNSLLVVILRKTYGSFGVRFELSSRKWMFLMPKE